jgi:tripartite-type tricarboxylate transporter receptor subunit TctC
MHITAGINFIRGSGHKFIPVVAGLVALALCVTAATASAQAKYPDQPIRMIVPFAPGGGVDQAARLIAKQMQVKLNVPIVVENRAGANGTVGGKAVQVAQPDGYTLLFSAATHILANQVMSKAPYDPIADFAPVARVGETPLLLVVSPDLKEQKLSDVIDAARKNPEKWTAALPAMGAPSHLATLLMAQKSNMKLTMAPYKGTAPALVDVAGGHAQILMDSIISLMPMARSGKVRALAVTSARRSALAPEVPTAAESGLPGLVYVSWYGIWAPKETARDRIQLLSNAINESVTELGKSGAFAALGIDSVTGTPEQFSKYITMDAAQSAELLKASGFKPE